jgi:2-haloacid dehalogenase
MTPPLDTTDIGACVFDAYGTLFDVNAAAAHCRDDLAGKADALAEMWRTKQLQYTWLRSLMGDFVDFWHVTGDALDFSMETLGLADPAMRARLMELYLNLDCYEEVPAMLDSLRGAGLKTAILSNGSMSMLESAVMNADLNERLDSVLSVDKLKVYKPDARVYQLAVDSLGVDAENVCFMSSNAWDAAGAAHFGFQVVWVNRFGQKAERLPGKPVAEITNLAELPPLLGV